MLGRYRLDWGHLAFVSLIAAAVVWYLLDAMAVSMSMNNLLFIAPVGLFALLLCCAIVPQCFRRTDGGVQRPRRVKSVTGMQELTVGSRKELVQICGLAAALGAMVFLLDAIGFDIAIWLFAVTVMLICGERRPIVLALFPLVSAVVIVGGFRAMLPYPMYTALL